MRKGQHLLWCLCVAHPILPGSLGHGSENRDWQTNGSQDFLPMVVGFQGGAACNGRGRAICWDPRANGPQQGEAAPCPLLSMDLEGARNKASSKRDSRETKWYHRLSGCRQGSPYVVAIAWQTWVSQKGRTFKTSQLSPGHLTSTGSYTLA